MAKTELPSEQITPKSLYTITGAAAAVWLFGAVLYTVLGTRADEVVYRSIAFGLSIIIAIGMLIEKKTFGLKYWLLIIPNSALIFINASGYNAVNNGGIKTPGVMEDIRKDSTTNTLLHVRHNKSVSEAAILPFLKDITWWPDPLMNQKVTQLKKINDSLKKENKMLNSDLETNTENKNKMSALEAQVQSLQEQNDLLRGDQKDAAFSATINKLNATISTLQRQLDDKDNQLKYCTGQFQQTKNSLASANERLDDCLKKGSSAESLNNRINTLSARLNESENSLKNCDSKLQKAENTIQSLTKQLKECKNKLIGDPDGSPVVQDLQSKLKKMEEKMSEYKNLYQACLKKGESSTDLNKKIELLEKDLNAARGLLKKCQSDLSQNGGRLKVVRDSLSRCLRTNG